VEALRCRRGQGELVYWFVQVRLSPNYACWCVYLGRCKQLPDQVCLAGKCVVVAPLRFSSTASPHPVPQLIQGFCAQLLLEPSGCSDPAAVCVRYASTICLLCCLHEILTISKQPPSVNIFVLNYNPQRPLLLSLVLRPRAGAGAAVQAVF
jgi:hypothetical protein